VADFLYKTTSYYAPGHERSIVWNDECIGIKWPVLAEHPTLSDKDRQGKEFGSADVFE